MIKILPMNETHVAAVAALEKVCFTDPWSESSVAYELRNPLSLWLVAEEDDRLVGYIGSQTVPPESDVMNVAVLPECRRRGIAEQLILELCRLLAENGNETLTLAVRASNAPAIALYEKLGFIQVGRRPNYYRNPREDAHILRKTF